MASSDLRDVLNLPTDGHPRPAKKQKTSAPRPNLKGLAREVQNLGGDNPIAIVPEVAVFKKKRFASRKPAARWELRAFKNSARGDGGNLILRHWRRKTEGETKATTDSTEDTEMANGTDKPTSAAETEAEDSAFAKFNVQVDLPQYSDDQYESNLKSDDWSKEETDYLLGLLRDFDLRWPLVWDRYDFVPEPINGEASADGDESKAIVPVPTPRTMEDLKARYYEVAAKMMAVQKPVQYMTQPEYALHELMAKFNPTQEKLRKEFATNALTRSKEEAKEEESLLLEIKRILARSDRFNEERRELYNRLDYPHTDQDISTFKSSTGLQTLLHTLMNADKSKKRKSLGGPEAASPSGPTPPAAAPETQRRESIAASTSGHGNHRESISSVVQTPTAAGNKKGAQSQERKKLSEAEKFVYGVTQHDRLTSGPTFRYEKINKMFTHKSNQQQMRITNTLNELDVPPRLTMPTAAVTAQFELLLGAVNSLLDARKVTDKIDAEIKIELAKKAERQKNMEPAADSAADDSTAKEGDAAAEATAEKAEVATKTGDEPEKVPNGEEKSQAEAGGGEAADKDAAAGATTAEQNGKASVPPKEDNAEADSSKGTRPGSSGASHKRSASVLSTVSDKSTKRQKK